MASSTTTNPSPTSDEQHQLSFPNYLSTLNVAIFVPSKLSGDENSNNYFLWRQQFLCLIESQGLLRFIDGQRVLDNAEWRTDKVVKGWILGTLADTVLRHVVNVTIARDVVNMTSDRDVWLEVEKNFNVTFANDVWLEFARIFNATTARDVWLELEKMFIPAPPPQTYDYEWSKYSPLYKATLKWDWEKAEEIINIDPTAINARIAFKSQTCLHIAVGTGMDIHFVRNLVNKMFQLDEMSSLKVKDDHGHTALHVAALSGNTEAAIILIDRCPDLLCVPDNTGNYPVHLAALSAHREILRCLILTANAPNDDPYRGQTGLNLLCILIKTDIFDLALHLAQKYPELAMLRLGDGTSALQTIALKDSAFSSGGGSYFSERLMYKLYTDIRISREKSRYDQKILRNDRQILRTHQQALDLVKCLCDNMDFLDFSASKIYADVMFTAARLDVHEVIEELVARFPAVIYSLNNYNQHIFHVAVENRSEKVFNLIYRMSNLKDQFLNEVDNSGNTLLHLAGRLAPSHKLNLVFGAALRMRRELQWFQEVQRLLHPCSCERSNKAGKTPMMVFTEEHMQLKDDGEKWMKETSTSCTIAAALVATVVFAAGITVPGGNRSDSGFPLLYTHAAFKLFAVFDSISLFTSVTSLLVFLSIFTSSCYAEHDFMDSLPEKLCLGLFTLLVSICSMLVTFSATIFMVFGRAENNWKIILVVTVLAYIPSAILVGTQLPVLSDVASTTYGRLIFGKQNTRLFF